MDEICSEILFEALVKDSRFPEMERLKEMFFYLMDQTEIPGRYIPKKGFVLEEDYLSFPISRNRIEIEVGEDVLHSFSLEGILVNENLKPSSPWFLQKIFSKRMRKNGYHDYKFLVKELQRDERLLNELKNTGFPFSLLITSQMYSETFNGNKITEGPILISPKADLEVIEKWELEHSVQYQERDNDSRYTKKKLISLKKY